MFDYRIEVLVHPRNLGGCSIPAAGGGTYQDGRPILVRRPLPFWAGPVLSHQVLDRNAVALCDLREGSVVRMAFATLKPAKRLRGYAAACSRLPLSPAPLRPQNPQLEAECLLC